jgi:hypothetical protein
MIDGFGCSRATATILRGPAMGGDFNALDRAVCASRWNQIAVRAFRGLGDGNTRVFLSQMWEAPLRCA